MVGWKKEKGDMAKHGDLQNGAEPKRETPSACDCNHCCTTPRGERGRVGATKASM
ncbi:hypothetical protein B0T18DRAFT_419272 [Schizothecium vesticola]|uniref:Uncharacterized protein n=1 Tax=Schizothecium vesticola TaxID=314040 RepID=A0AA40EKJ0_9PEZI|nr:hypothetical protein B0T18DRAFT_419272 [Schizothecium vesticola]